MFYVIKEDHTYRSPPTIKLSPKKQVESCSKTVMQKSSDTAAQQHAARAVSRLSPCPREGGARKLTETDGPGMARCFENKRF